MYIFHIVLYKKFFFYCIDIYFVCYIKTSMVYYGALPVLNDYTEVEKSEKAGKQKSVEDTIASIQKVALKR